jgi:hypothetical protein
VDPDAREALEHGDRHRIGGHHVLDARRQDLLEQRGGRVGEALVDGLRGHLHPKPPGHLGELLDGSLRIS